MKSSRPKALSRFENWLVIIALLFTGSGYGEEFMIYPVPTMSDVDMKNPDHRLDFYSRIGRGNYLPLPLPGYTDKRELHFETAFEECAPGRNSAANEWSAFGVMGGTTDFNAMGREMWVRYPAFELVFRLYKDGKEVKPDSLESFRLGLVNNRLPAIWGGWQDNGLVYKVSVMTVPDPKNGNFDLYKLEIQNPTEKPITSELAAALDGPPDLRLEDGVVRGLGDAAFVIADEPVSKELILRDYGLCDKRAKSYKRGTKKSWEDGMRTYRLGMDGLPVVYQFKAQRGKKYLVYLVSPYNLKGYYLRKPEEIGDYIVEYQVEGCPAQTLDYIEYLRYQRSLKKSEHPQISSRFAGAEDKDGDGYIEVRSGVTSESKCRYTVLGMIYVFAEGTTIDDESDIYSGKLNRQCVWHIDVGATPEQDWKNQYYDASDVGIARLKLNYTVSVAPGKVQTYWLKVPPIHRREAVSMHYIAHAFRDVLPGEAVPPFGKDKVEALKKADPQAAWRLTVDYWNAFFAPAARFELPDPVLTDIYYSRLATRAILDVKINDQVWYNACSPFFYFDFSYRDHCYSVVARNMSGMTQEAEKLANTYCVDAKDVKEKGPIWFTGAPLQLGMQEDGMWLTRPGQYDTPGQNLWGMVEHYKFTGDRDWLEKQAWPFVRRGAMWIVNSRHKNMKAISDSADPRYGLIEPGAMEVAKFDRGVYMYYMDAFAVLGLKEAADAALALDQKEDFQLFHQEYLDLKNCLHKSFQHTFKRTGLYQGFLWYGVESEAQGAGMFGDWAHNALVWPCGAIDPHDPMWTATLRNLEYKNQTEGAGMHVGWPYITVDLAVGALLRGEMDKTLDIFCAYTDTAGGTFSWGEGYFDKDLNLTNGDQPHNWADVYWLILFRNLFAFEDGDNLLLTPALFRRWHQGDKVVTAKGLPTYFGVLDLEIHPNGDGSRIDYSVKITPRGDQEKRPLQKIVLFPRTVTGNAIQSVQLNGQSLDSFSRDTVILSRPLRGQTMKIQVDIEKN